MISMWNERYSEQGFAYGTKPNDFLQASIESLTKGKTLCLAEGEGRNAVFLAMRGFEVTAVDLSSVGLEKAQRLADENGVTYEQPSTKLTSSALPTRKAVTRFPSVSKIIRYFLSSE